MTLLKALKPFLLMYHSPVILCCGYVLHPYPHAPTYASFRLPIYPFLKSTFIENTLSGGIVKSRPQEWVGDEAIAPQVHLSENVKHL